MKTTLICLFSIIALTACSNRDDHTHPDLKSGEALFNHHCAECHNEDGTGKLADGTPASILTRKNRQSIIEYILSDVNPERKMPVFRAMPASEAGQIADHLLTLKRVYDATPAEKKKNNGLLIEP